MTLWTILLEMRMILQNISRRVVENVLISISPSDIFQLSIVVPDNFDEIP